MKQQLVESPVMNVFNLHLQARDPTIFNFNFPLVEPSDEFQEPSQFHSHSPWPECKVALMFCLPWINM